MTLVGQVVEAQQEQATATYFAVVEVQRATASAFQEHAAAQMTTAAALQESAET